MFSRSISKLNHGVIFSQNSGNMLMRGFASLQQPHGGKLKDSIVKDPKMKAELVKSADIVVDMNERQSCDTELIINGGFSPLDGFMTKDVYDSVVDKMRLPGSNLLFGMPVVLDTDRKDVVPGKKVLLRYEGADIALMEVQDRWTPDKPKEALKVYGTSALEHPGTRVLAWGRANDYVGGKLIGLNIPKRVFDCQPPSAVREMLPAADVVAFQCRNPIHRAHYELFTRALDAPNVNKKAGAVVLVHPTCGPTQEDDISGKVRYETYLVLKEETHDPQVKWAYLPYSMLMAGPREAIQHMIIRKNYGCTHFIIGRDMAGSKSSVTGEDFYGPYEAQDFAKKHAEELGMQTVPSLNLVYTKEGGYITADEAEKKGYKPVKLSGTEFRRKLRAGEDIPEWFAFKSVVEVLRKHV